MQEVALEPGERRARDTTKPASEAGIEDAQQKAELLELAHDAILVRDIETNTIRYWNRGAETTYGWTAAEAVGRSIHWLLRTEFPQSFVEIARALYATGFWEGELVHYTRDLRRLVVLSRWAIQRDPNGRPIAILEINRDITLRKQTEARLEEQLRAADRARGEAFAILDASAEGMILVSPEDRFLSVNRRFGELFGIVSESLVGQTFADIKPSLGNVFADPLGFYEQVRDSAADPDRSFSFIAIQSQPQARELEVSTSPVKSGRGDFLGRLFVFRDVTRAREIDRMKTEFVSLVSHELRTPLTSIKGFADLLLDDPTTLGGEQREFLEIIRSNADRLVALINDLLDISRIESDRVELHNAPVDLGVVLRGVVATFRPQLEAKAQSLTLTIDPDLPFVLGDSDRLAQIFMNLLSNAHKYTGRGGKILIRAAEVEQQVQVSIADTGIGMSQEEQAQIFTKFYRARNRTTQQVGGTGLGLAITRSLVQMHHGEISVQSAPDVGSTFQVTLPAISRPERVTPRDLPGPTRAHGEHILIVDDEPDIASLLQRYLERAGYRTQTATSASEALTVARTERPDLITLDIGLKDTNGLAALEWLKSDPFTERIPVMLISVFDEGERAAQLGAVDFLPKPVDEKTLVSRVAAVLRHSPARESSERPTAPES
jgi:PAS domain S-box-containing protein